MRTHCLWDQGEWFVIYNKDTALLTESQRITAISVFETLCV